MPLTLPNLDDRRYADLMEEARGLLVSYAPALTNHNPSDPVITLAELFAYFTEILLFRLNYVTDANRIAFLKLLNGSAWQPPASRDALDGAIRDTVLMLRQTDRAVTPADFEFLARAADPAGGVARARCIPERNLDTDDPIERQQAQPGHVSVVIVPRPNADLAPLRAIVAAYLEPRRLLAARVHVVGPRAVPVRVRVTLRSMPDALESDVRARAIDALKNFLDPIVGRDGDGWPFGRSVYVSEIYRLLDTLPGVDFVRRTVDPQSTDAPPAQLDELATATNFAGRVERNGVGELIRIALDSDELIDYRPPVPGTDTEFDIVVEQPPTAV